MFIVYAIRIINRTYIYVGLTSNLEERFRRHNSGNNKTTAPYAPFRLLYVEKLSDRGSARAREKYLKSGVGKEFLKSIEIV